MNLTPSIGNDQLSVGLGERFVGKACGRRHDERATFGLNPSMRTPTIGDGSHTRELDSRRLGVR
jgi:hypothetical protein